MYINHLTQQQTDSATYQMTNKLLTAMQQTTFKLCVCNELIIIFNYATTTHSYT